MDIPARLKEIMQLEAEAIVGVQVTPHFEEAVRALRYCTGKVITTGIGKAGHIAQKFAATLCSTGTPAAFLHPAEAGHGDLGLLSHEDCLVAFSTSGKSVEVLEMLELSRHLGVKTIIGVTSHPDSKLRELSDIIVEMGQIKEACPLGLTPTSTIAVMLAISDALALTVMELKGTTREDFGLRHHGGYLGRKARMDNQ
jgi:arabinose-5-phosphate isomerase